MRRGKKCLKWPFGSSSPLLGSCHDWEWMCQFVIPTDPSILPAVKCCRSFITPYTDKYKQFTLLLKTTRRHFPHSLLTSKQLSSTVSFGYDLSVLRSRNRIVPTVVWLTPLAWNCPLGGARNCNLPQSGAGTDGPSDLKTAAPHPSEPNPPET